MDIAVEDLRVVRNGRLVLDVPRLHVRPRQTTALLGPNGSGKTTLLRIIAGLERAAAGHVRLDGTVVDRPQPVAYVFQEQVFLRRSVRENLALGPSLRGVSRREITARIAHAAELFGIGVLLDRRADRLSGGEARRVSLARALCLRAPLVLLDEPLEGLDERTYGRLLDELPRVLAAFDATTLLVTHSRHEALRLADDLIVLVDGRVCAAGAARTVARQPGTRAVADVLGYTVLGDGTRLLAVPPHGLRPGPGRFEFLMTVDAMVELVEAQEAVGRIGATPVRIALPPGSAVRLDEPLLVHADSAAELER